MSGLDGLGWPTNDDREQTGGDCVSRLVRLLAVAQPVMEAWAKSHELDEWHCRCEDLIGTAYPRNLCPVCCVESSINWRGGKPYYYCPYHGELDDLYCEPNA